MALEPTAHINNVVKYIEKCSIQISNDDTDRVDETVEILSKRVKAIR